MSNTIPLQTKKLRCVAIYVAKWVLRRFNSMKRPKWNVSISILRLTHCSYVIMCLTTHPKSKWSYLDLNARQRNVIYLCTQSSNLPHLMGMRHKYNVVFLYDWERHGYFVYCSPQKGTSYCCQKGVLLGVIYRLLGSCFGVTLTTSFRWASESSFVMLITRQSDVHEMFNFHQGWKPTRIAYNIAWSLIYITFWLVLFNTKTCNLTYSFLSDSDCIVFLFVFVQ